MSQSTFSVQALLSLCACFPEESAFSKLCLNLLGIFRAGTGAGGVLIGGATAALTLSILLRERQREIIAMGCNFHRCVEVQNGWRKPCGRMASWTRVKHKSSGFASVGPLIINRDFWCDISRMHAPDPLAGKRSSYWTLGKLRDRCRW